MPSVQPMIDARDAVNLELTTHFTHLATHELVGCQHETIGRYASQGVARGFALMALHQLMLSLQLDELEEQQALAVQN